MLFSYKCLGSLVDLRSISVEELSSRLTFSGFEVEGISKMAEASKLTIGQVLTCVPHPDSNHLHVLTVDCGKFGIKNIVCGAPNVRVGLKVIVALEGCELPFLHETIKKGAIRGVASEGMCCSLLELGVSKENLSENSPSLNGIEELDDDALVGEDNVLEYLGLNDTVLDINVLPNRPDCLSYIGMAREIASLTGREISYIPTLDSSSYSDNIAVRSKTINCPRIDMLLINDIKPKAETPLYIRRVLQANNIRSISPIVDLGNYVMLLTGQPLNMYDADKNTSGEYTVMDDYEGEFTAFDGKKLDLIKGDIVIADNEDILCLGGIEAGKKACVDETTKDVMVEFATFYHSSIRHTCSRLGLSSPSSILFGKGRNPRMIKEAVAVTISLLGEFFDSYKVVSYSFFDRSIKENKPFKFSYEALNKRLGTSYTEAEINDVLKAYRIKKLDENTLLAPLDRVDLLEQCDIDEEVFRYYPANRVKPTFEHFPITTGGLNREQKITRALRELFVNKGLNEILSFTLISEKEEDSINVFKDNDYYRLVNPMTKDHEIVRTDLLPSMISTLRYNIAHQNKDLALFEISPIETKNAHKTYLSFGLAGTTSLCDDYKSRPFDFFDLKGLIEAVFEKLGINSGRYRLAYSKNCKFHPNCSADIFFGKDLVGTFGKLHPSFVKEDFIVGELDLSYLLNLKGGKTKFVPFSSYPTVRRDLSFKMNDKVDYQTLKKCIMKVRDSYVKDVLFFDDFKDKESGEHYLGLSLILGKEDGTLKDAEIQSAISNVVNAVKKELSLTLRGE